MLWKKRWFVLSEYCLFYYKGESTRCTIDIFFPRILMLFFPAIFARSVMLPHYATGFNELY